MCGIVAVIGSREAAPLLLEGLRQLEYRGYDSAGIATFNGERHLSCLRAEGKLVNLTHRCEASGAAGQCGISHTRLAMHGEPEERNAHPHLDGPGRVAVVQKGIIENDRTLREELQAEGVVFCILASGSANSRNESGVGLSEPAQEEAGTSHWALHCLSSADPTSIFMGCSPDYRAAQPAPRSV